VFEHHWLTVGSAQAEGSMSNQLDQKWNASQSGKLPRLRGSRFSRGQTMVEFAMGAVLTLVVMLVGVQFAIIGQAALALNQGASALARYAAVHPGTVSSGKASSLPSSARNLLSPTILTGSGGDLTVTVQSLTPTGAPEKGTLIQGQDQVVINLSYNAAGKVVLPTNTLLGLEFPTTLTASNSQLYE
jgi:Flp pilus assembly protein TadG